MNNKKVLFLLEAFDKGGIEQVTLDIVNNLDPEKYDITVQTFWYGGHCQSQVNSNVRVIPFFFKRYVRGIIRLIQYFPASILYRLFVHGDYDVEIAASDGGAAKVISGSNNKHAKKICWVHMDVVNRGSKLKEYDDSNSARKIYGKFDFIVPVSESCKRQFVSKFGEDYNYIVKRNPIPVEQIIRQSYIELNYNFKDSFSFVSVGRLEVQKGYDRLINACKTLMSDDVPPFHVYIIGDGSQHEVLQRQIESEELQDNITLLGFQTNPYNYIRNADAFVLSSRDEAFPLVIGESLVVGTPVLATNCCGISEWLQDGRYGLIVDNSENGILFGMKQFLLHPELLDSYKERIPEVLEQVSFENVLKQFEDLLV